MIKEKEISIGTKSRERMLDIHNEMLRLKAEQDSIVVAHMEANGVFDAKSVQVKNDFSLLRCTFEVQEIKKPEMKIHSKKNHKEESKK